jgi:hypothetical protein
MATIRQIASPWLEMESVVTSHARKTKLRSPGKQILTNEPYTNITRNHANVYKISEAITER